MMFESKISLPLIKVSGREKLAAFSFVLLLSTWLAIPFGASGDMDYHLTSIWCAWGERPGLCDNIQTLPEDPNARFSNHVSAEVPFMFQICDSRNIDYWPYCEFEANHPETQRLRMAPSEHMSFYYRIMNLFASDNIQLSVLMIRIVNIFISAIMLYLLLTLTKGRLKFSAISGFTFSMIPYGIQHFSGVTTRSWAIIGVMTSWAFLSSFLTTPKSETQLRRLRLFAYLFAVFLALSTRLDALLMVAISSIFVLILHLTSDKSLTSKQIIAGISTFVVLGFASQFLPVVKQYANFVIPESYGTAQYILFQILHIPEFVADWWNYQIGQSGSGPGIIGIIGIILFAINIAFALQKASARQSLIFIFFSLIVFLLLAKTSSVGRTMVPLSGFYTLGLAVPWLGICILNSKNRFQFMSTTGNRCTAFILLTFSHAAYFYSLLEFYTRRGQRIGWFESISLNDVWWWNLGIGPNFVFLFGAIMFPVFLVTTWRSIPAEPTGESTLL
jgi:hypothetical protein